MPMTRRWQRDLDRKQQLEEERIPAVRLRCAECGEYKDDVGDSTCTTFEPDSNPFGKIPVYGVHTWVEAE
jgi:hypothetical protein